MRKQRVLVLIFACLGAVVASAEVAQDPWAVRPLLPGMQAPEFTATDAYGKPFEFFPSRLQRPAVLIFYRGGWCPFCNLHWSELRAAEDKLLSLGVDLIFLSADSPQVLAEAVADEDDVPRYHLLSDASTTIAEAFGIAFRVDDSTYERYTKFGIDLENVSGFKHHNLPVPAVFIVDTQGIVRFQYANPDYKVRLHPDVLVAAARTMPSYRLKLN